MRDVRGFTRSFRAKMTDSPSRGGRCLRGTRSDLPRVSSNSRLCGNELRGFKKRPGITSPGGRRLFPPRRSRCGCERVCVRDTVTYLRSTEQERRVSPTLPHDRYDSHGGPNVEIRPCRVGRNLVVWRGRLTADPPPPQAAPAAITGPFNSPATNWEHDTLARAIGGRGGAG